MSGIEWVIVAIVIIALVYLYLAYTGLISKKNHAQAALSSVDVQLQKRANLVPNLLKIAQSYMEHETELMTELTKLRDQPTRLDETDDQNAFDARLRNSMSQSEGISRFFAVSENYPDMKSEKAVQEAQEAFEESEANIAAARRFYNSAVESLNSAVETFPSSLMAGAAKARRMPFFEMTNAQAAAPIDADQFLKPR